MSEKFVPMGVSSKTSMPERASTAAHGDRVEDRALGAQSRPPGFPLPEFQFQLEHNGLVGRISRAGDVPAHCRRKLKTRGEPSRFFRDNRTHPAEHP